MSPVAINGVDKQGVAINGVQVKQALDAANEIVNKGVYDPTTLSAVDADLAVGNIKDTVNIFGKVGTLAAGITFADYHYYADLADSATYTPPAQSQALFCNEESFLNWDFVFVEFWDGSGWITGYTTTEVESTCHIFQDDDQNLRVRNLSGTARKISLTGVTWTAGFTNYHYYEDLANGATYTPPAKAIASFFGEEAFIYSALVIQFYDGSAWFQAQSVTRLENSRLIFQDNDQNIRIRNFHADARKISLTGVTY